mmetsp:Transcript_30733/g.82297  ORF Transcript_30733/g.82297 Transcript_30733/m.82297 type:complete len:269 (-) Transcript_30733:212-1018(-)
MDGSPGGDETIQQHEAVEEPKCIFYSAWFCPYAQRAWIALEAKNVRYRWVETVLYEEHPSTKRSLSLAQKKELTPGFVECSPRGLVPGLECGSDRIFDSLPLMEYIEEAFEGSSLMPSSLASKAHIRSGIMLWSELVVRKFYSLLMSKTPEAVELEKQALLAGFEEMVPYFCRDGNFFSSHGFSMFECSALPWFQRLPVLRKYRGFALPDGEPYRRLTAWYEACLAVPCFARTVVDETRLVQCYVGYANGTGTSNCAQLTKGLNGDYA